MFDSEQLCKLLVTRWLREWPTLHKLSAAASKSPRYLSASSWHSSLFTSNVDFQWQMSFQERRTLPISMHVTLAQGFLDELTQPIGKISGGCVSIFHSLGSTEEVHHSKAFKHLILYMYVIRKESGLASLKTKPPNRPFKSRNCQVRLKQVNNNL